MSSTEVLSLRERLAAFAAEAQEERESLEARRKSLAVERDEEVNAIQDRHMRAMRAEVEQVRADWRARVAEVEEELQAAKRLDRALNPSAPKSKQPKRGPERKGPHWRPRDETLRAALQAMRDGADTVPMVTDASSFSRAAMDHAVAVLREDGFVRLTGERKARNSHTNVRTYAMTPAGQAFLTANETGNNGSQA